MEVAEVSPIICGGFDGVVSADCSTFSGTVSGGGVFALEGGGGDGAELNNFFLCSDFCFLRSLAASISALFCSRASKFPVLVTAPSGTFPENKNDI